MDVEKMEKAGIDYKAGLKRFMDDIELYNAVLSAFVNDDVLERAKAAYESRDRGKLLAVAHEVKGSSGNADLTVVFKEASMLVTLLRSKKYSDDELKDCYENFTAAYCKVREGIKVAMEG